MVDGCLFDGRAVGVDVVDRRGEAAGEAGGHDDEDLLHGGEMAAGFSVGGGNHDVGADHGVRLVELLGGLEEFAVDLQGLVQVGGSEVGGECEGQPEKGGELGGEKAGAKQPDGDV